MSVTKKIGLIALSGALLAGPVQAQNAKLLAARLYDRISAASPQQAQSQLIRESLGALRSQPCFAQMQPRIEEMVRKYSQVDGARDMAINSFSQQFTAQELKQLIAFSDTPLGQKFFRVQPVIASRAAQMAMEHFQGKQMAIAQETMDIIQSYKNADCQQR